MINYLDELNKINKLEELQEYIVKIFKLYEDEQYMPALIKQGMFTVEDGEDFYLKLILKHTSIDINRTWMKNNMVFGLGDPEDKDNYIENLLVTRRYKSNSLYQVNPLIIDESVSEYEYNNTEYVNSYYNDEYSATKGKAVLKLEEDGQLLIIKDVLKNYINDKEGNIYPKYELVAEFEYRTHDKRFNNIEVGEHKLDDSYMRIDKSSESVYLLGSVKVPYIYKPDTEKVRDIRVLNMDDLIERKHNPKNYTGDINEGFIYFKKDVIDLLVKDYYIYDLQIYDKHNLENSYMIDILEDKVMFFEGEYNKLPSRLKDKIDQYNFIPESKGDGYISSAMFAWQLESDWNWDKKLSPCFKLATEIKRKMFEAAIDIGISFEVPKDLDSFRVFVNKIENLTGVKLEKYNPESRDVISLKKIRDGMEEKVDDLEGLYQKYCYAIVRELSDDEY